MGKLFEKGNPGKRKGAVCGRKKALAELDYVAAQTKTRKKLRKALQDKANDTPMAFFTNLIMPLLPKESQLELSGDLDIAIKAIVTKSGKIEQKEVGNGK